MQHKHKHNVITDSVSLCHWLILLVGIIKKKTRTIFHAAEWSQVVFLFSFGFTESVILIFFFTFCSFTGSTENPQLFVILCNSVVLCVHFTCSFSESEFALLAYGVSTWWGFDYDMSGNPSEFNSNKQTAGKKTWVWDMHSLMSDAGLQFTIVTL